MTKIRKVKRRKTYKVNINRKRLRNKLRKVPTITCPQIKKAWDGNKSTKSNLVQMGLAYNPNQVLKIPNLKKDSLKIAKRKVSGELFESEDEPENKKRIQKKIEVAKELEAEAKAPRERMFKLPKGQVLFLTYLMDKYGDDYKAMVNDKKNYYQLTWRQIRQKINTFKGIPEQYAEYLVQKGEILLDDPTPLEETKKKIGQENLKKYCQPKKPKKKSLVSQWIEESIEDVNEDENEDTFETTKTLDDDKNKKCEKSGKDDAKKSSKNGKKLKLFPDDGSDEENSKSMTTKTKKKEKGKREKLLEKLSSSDSEDSEEELEGEGNEGEFKDLSDMSDEELSEDDILDDGEFVTDSDEESE